MKALLSLVILMSLTSCASQKKVEQEVKAKAANETKVSDGKTLGMTIHDVIHSSKTLTDAQKAELDQIIVVNKQKSEALTEESFKFRSVLIKSLLSGKINPKEIKAIKKDITRIERAKLKNTFDTVEKITKIVSNHPDNQQFAEHLIYMERPLR